MKRYKVVFFIVILLIWPYSLLVAVDKAIIQKSSTAREIDRLTVDTVLGEPTLVVTYHVVDDYGRWIGNQRVVTVVLKSTHITMLKDFVTTVVLPAVNEQEGT